MNDMWFGSPYVVACSRLVSFWKEKLCSYLPIDDDTCAMEQHPCMCSSYFHRPGAASAKKFPSPFCVYHLGSGEVLPSS